MANMTPTRKRTTTPLAIHVKRGQIFIPISPDGELTPHNSQVKISFVIAVSLIL